MRDPHLATDDDFGDDERQVLRALSLPAIAPLSDKSTSSIAGRTDLGSARVDVVLRALDAIRPRIVRHVDWVGGEFWVALDASRRLLEPQS
jgi:hypothetical protein